MESKRHYRVSLLAVIPLALLLSSALLVTFDHNWAWIVYAADSYGSDLLYIEVWQYNGTHWNMLKNFTSSGGTQRIRPNRAIMFNVGCKLNDSLAVDNSEAVEFSQVLMNITYNNGVDFIWDNIELNNTAVSKSGGYYWLEEQGNWTSSLAQAGVIYNCSVSYQSFY